MTILDDITKILSDLKIKLSKNKLNEKTVSSCIADLSLLKEAGLINLTERYTKIDTISGGKSGALIFIVEDSNKDRYILKFYNKKKNSRPFREILCMCVLSGTSGFPELIEMGYANKPLEWHPRIKKDSILGLYVVMKIVPGVTLSKYNIKSNPKDALNISLSILHRILQARCKLGKSFEHFDLHPDNIFINDKCTNEKLYYKNDTYITQCPSVTIIDFDLVEADKIDFLPYEKAQNNKRYGYFKIIQTIVPEKTWEFIYKWLQSIIALFKKLNYVRNIRNTDVRNWIIITSVILDINKIDDTVITCTDMEDCLNKNKHLFESLKE